MLKLYSKIHQQS